MPIKSIEDAYQRTSFSLGLNSYRNTCEDLSNKNTFLSKIFKKKIFQTVLAFRNNNHRLQKFKYDRRIFLA